MAGLKRPTLGRLTTRLLVVYFLLALGAHARIRDRPLRFGPALALLVWSAATTSSYDTGTGAGRNQGPNT